LVAGPRWVPDTNVTLTLTSTSDRHIGKVSHCTHSNEYLVLMKITGTGMRIQNVVETVYSGTALQLSCLVVINFNKCFELIRPNSVNMTRRVNVNLIHFCTLSGKYISVARNFWLKSESSIQML
jgi:hypothetical protein